MAVVLRQASAQRLPAGFGEGALFQASRGRRQASPGGAVEKVIDGPISACLSLSSDPTAEDRFGRTVLRNHDGCTVVRQRLVVASHHHTKRNASRQSMNDGRAAAARLRGSLKEVLILWLSTRSPRRNAFARVSP